MGPWTSYVRFSADFGKQTDEQVRAVITARHRRWWSGAEVWPPTSVSGLNCGRIVHSWQCVAQTCDIWYLVICPGLWMSPWHAVPGVDVKARIQRRHRFGFALGALCTRRNIQTNANVWFDLAFFGADQDHEEDRKSLSCESVICRVVQCIHFCGRHAAIQTWSH